MQHTTQLIVIISLLSTAGAVLYLLPFLRGAAGRAGQAKQKAKQLQELDAHAVVPISALPPWASVKISGEVQPSGSGLVAPVSGRRCVYWAVTLYSRTINPRLKSDAPFRIVFEEQAVPFTLRDESGEARIELGTRETTPPSPGAMWQQTRFRDADVLRAQTLRRRTEEMAPQEKQRLLTMFGYPPGTYQESVRVDVGTLLTEFAFEEARIEAGERLMAFGQGSRANGQGPLVLAPAAECRLLLASTDTTAGVFRGNEGLKMAGFSG